MSKEFGAMEVIVKATGEKQTIKSVRFNPELHKQVSDIFTMRRDLDYSQPVNIQLDGIEGALARGEAQREKDLAAKRAELEETKVEVKEEITPAEIVEELIDTPSEEAENKVEIDLSNITEDKVKDLSWNELRKLAKSLGILSYGVTSELLQAQVIEKLPK